MKAIKKLLSVVLTLTLLVSTLALLATTASAADYVFMRDIEINKQILGAYNYDNGYVGLAEDPTLPGSGIRVLRMHKTGKDQYGYIGLASDTTANATEFEYEPNANYALSFDYMLGEDATIASFGIFYGQVPTYSSTVAGKLTISSKATGVSLDYKGDGKFHNAVITFTAPAADASRPHIYLRVQGSGDSTTVVHTYIKNLKLVRCNVGESQSGGWDVYFTNVNKDETSGEFTYDYNAGTKDVNGNTIYAVSGWTSDRMNLTTSGKDGQLYYHEDGTVSVQTHTRLNYVNGAVIGAVSLTVPAAGDEIKPYVINKGTTYDISVKIKFPSNATADSMIAIGLLTNDKGTYLTTANHYYIIPFAVAAFGTGEFTETDTWYTLSLTDWVAPASAVLRIGASGTAKIAIDKVDIKVHNNNTAIATFNDNGTSYERLVVKGAKLDGFNAAGVDGAEFEGWYTTATFDEGTKVDAVPDTDTITLYAKYASTAVDYEMVSEGSIRNEKLAEDNNGTYQSAGVRFKGRVTESFRESADEIGFIAIPTAMLNGVDISEYSGNGTISAKVVGEGMDDIIYYEGDGYYDYQLIITGLTREGHTVNMLNTEITVALYAIVDGATVYSNSIAYSYNDVFEAINKQ